MHLKEFRAYGKQRAAEGRDGWEAGRRGGRGQGVEDSLINRVSDSAHFCPWDESSCARQCSTSWGIVGNKRLFSPVVLAHHRCILRASHEAHTRAPEDKQI